MQEDERNRRFPDSHSRQWLRIGLRGAGATDADPIRTVRGAGYALEAGGV